MNGTTAQRPLLARVLQWTTVFVILVSPSAVFAAETADATALEFRDLWLLICAVTVFFMQAGFKCYEVGMVRRKNITEVGIKNVIDWTICTLVFAIIGFGLMFGRSVGPCWGAQVRIHVSRAGRERQRPRCRKYPQTIPEPHYGSSRQS